MNTLGEFLPDSIMGWEPEGLDGLYGADTLFDLIDGGAEVYRALNVKAILSRRYTRHGEPDILIDLFDMGSSSDAFGAYRHDMREGVGAEVGQESEFLDSSLYFWKDRYFVSLISLDETENSGKALKAFATRIAQAIPREGDMPGLLRLLPEKGLVRQRIHYFHDKMLLDRHCFISEENILSLNQKTEGLLAGYESGVKASGDHPEQGGRALSPMLLLVAYPDEKASKKAHESFLRLYLPDADEQGRARTENHGWTAAAIDRDLFIGAFDMGSPGEADRLIKEVKQRRQKIDSDKREIRNAEKR
ncbi:MAG: DUF6599 family protein [Planctomycetota bacterium]